MIGMLTGARCLAALLPLLFVAAPPAVAQNEGGSTQVSAQSGCMNKWMFDGMWRVRVTKVALAPNNNPANNHWEITMQWANGTALDGLTPGQSLKQDLVLALKNGDTVTASAETTGALNQQTLDDHAFPASGQFTYTQKFFVDPTADQANPPAKLLITFDVAAYRRGHPGGDGKLWRQKTINPNYRIDLTCGATT